MFLDEWTLGRRHLAPALGAGIAQVVGACTLA
jgi:hypothetical protein